MTQSFVMVEKLWPYSVISSVDSLASWSAGDSHPDTLTSTSNLAFTFKHQSKHEATIMLMKECHELRKVVLGAEHPYAQSSYEALKEWG